MMNLLSMFLFSAPPSERLLDLCSSSSGAILVPGVHDALSARIFAQQGASAMFLSGFGVSSTLLGQPDAGILTYSEMESIARVVCCGDISGDVPVMVDGDTGYGGAARIRRAVRGLAQAGAAAITIEDQVFPKKCTYIAGEGVRVVDRQASVDRIQTALVARQEAWERDGNRVLIVGRTDCRAALGLSEALSRCLAYQEMGCDIVYAENLQSPDEYMELRNHISKRTPLMLAQVQTGSPNQHLYTLQDITDMGYQLALMGITGLQATVQALQNVAKEMQVNEGLVQNQSLASFERVKQVVDFGDLEDFESKYYCE